MNRPPAFVVVPAVLGLGFVSLPVLGLLANAPWSELGSLLTSEFALSGLRLSVLSSVAAVGISLVIGLPIAWVLARVEFRGRSLVRGLVLLPLVLPPVVGGASLLFALGRSGLIGGPVHEATGLVLPFSTSGVIVAATFVAMPFLIITVEGALVRSDTRYEGVASSLGAGRWTVFRRVTLPMIWPSLLSGLVLTWARAFGEFGATITFAGNLPGETQTLPLAVFIAMETDRDAALALSVLMMVVSLGVLVALRDRWWRLS